MVNIMMGPEGSGKTKQLIGALKAEIRSWDTPRAIYNRRMHDLPAH